MESVQGSTAGGDRNVPFEVLNLILQNKGGGETEGTQATQAELPKPKRQIEMRAK